MTTSLDKDVDRLRAFSRFYTRRIGVLTERPFGGDFSLAESRVLFELAHRDHIQPALLADELGLDRAYLSRILARFRKLGYVRSRPSPEDGRSVLISITPAGEAAFAPLNAFSNESVGALLADLAPAARQRLVAAAEAMEHALSEPSASPPVQYRDLAIGDLGWIVRRQGILYAEEYGWDGTYEALVAEILGQFVRDFDPAREKSWIADRAGEILGSIFLVKSDDPDVAKLRLLYVEPSARGLGIGAALTRLCIEGARWFGYRRLELWTNDVLFAARRIYQAAGFELVAENPHHSFGKDLIGQTWRLDL